MFVYMYVCMYNQKSLYSLSSCLLFEYKNCVCVYICVYIYLFITFLLITFSEKDSYLCFNIHVRVANLIGTKNNKEKEESREMSIFLSML